MRKVLLRFVFDDAWSVQPVGNELHIGIGWLLTVWAIAAIVSVTILWRQTRSVRETGISLGFWSVIPIGLAVVSRSELSIVADGIPVFGYGFMMFVGFITGTLLAVYHARRIGMDAQVIWDLMMWLLVPGLIGARLFYVTQYYDRVFEGTEGLQFILKLFSVQDGGLVFYGSVIGGALGGLMYCLHRKIRPLQLADVVAPSLFVGVGFGRIGCFLYGCCYGGACTLPWAVQFPPDSLTYMAQLQDGTIKPGALSTTSLHPTQIYSSVLGFILAGVLVWFFRRRPFEGFVLGLMLVLYPINRFALELIRNDEKGQLGTSLTISQLISIVLFISGISLLVWLSRKGDSAPPRASMAQTG